MDEWKMVNRGRHKTWSTTYPMTDGKELLVSIVEDGFTIVKQEVLYILYVIGQQRGIYNTLEDAQWHSDDIIATEYNNQGIGWVRT